MTATYSKDLGIYTAKQFKNSFSSANVYLTIGYSKPWVNDYSPPQANTSDASYYDTWKNMIGGKRIVGSDIRHVIKRHDWTTGTAYTAYDDLSSSLTFKDGNTSMYVMTTDFNVYKCIANNNGGLSTSKPESTTTSTVFQTADKYIWKYMYTLTSEEQLRFMTADYIPVKTLIADDSSLQWQVQENSVDGAINNIVRTNPGTGYTSNSITVTITGDGQFANAYAVRNVVTAQVESIIVDVKGSGYTYANAVITSSHGTGATARVIIDPPGGHGADPLHELGGSFLMINTKLDGSEDQKLPINNDYRQICILENPYVYQTTNLISNLAFSQLTTLFLGSGTFTEYVDDEIVYQGANLANATYRGVVTVWDSANSLLKLTNVVGTPTAQLIIGNTSTASRYVSAVIDPDLQPYSGYLLYKDNIQAIERSEDQSEDFKIVLSF